MNDSYIDYDNSIRNSILATKSIYNTIESFYPGLIVLRDNLLYLNVDEGSLGSDSLEHRILPNSIKLIGDYFMMTLHCETRDVRKDRISMEYDFGLSDEVCMSLYKHDISIYHSDSGPGPMMKYDRVAIERRWTIKNIINE